MAGNSVDRIYPEGLITNPDYDPQISTTIVGNDFKKVIDFVIGSLVETDAAGYKRTDINYRYRAPGGEIIRRRTGSSRARLMSGVARYINNHIYVNGLRSEGQPAWLLLENSVAEYRVRGIARERPLKPVSWAAFFYEPGVFYAQQAFTHERSGEAFMYTNPALAEFPTKLYDRRGGDKTLKESGLDSSALRRMAVLLNAASMACRQQLTVEGHLSSSSAVDPYDRHPGMGGRTMDLILARPN